MLSTLNVRSHSHNCCEDALYVHHKAFSIIGGIFDGCSTGTKSHWAAQTFAYLFSIESQPLSDKAIFNVMSKASQLAREMSLDEMNFLCTCMLFEYNLQTAKLKIRLFGDGVYYINGKEFQIDQDDKPDYIGYNIFHLQSLHSYLARYQEIIYDEVTDFKICSDGIKSFSINQFETPPAQPHDLLLAPPTNENYLKLMYNKLRGMKYIIQDDLSIISYVNEKRQEN